MENKLLKYINKQVGPERRFLSLSLSLSLSLRNKRTKTLATTHKKSQKITDKESKTLEQN